MPVYDGFRPQVIEEFMGLYTTLRAQDCPPNYAPVCNNAAFDSGGVDSRPGTAAGFDLGGGTDVLHAEKITVADTDYYLFLMQDNKLYYSTGGARTLVVDPGGTPTHFQAIVYGALVFLFFSDGNYGVTEARVWSISGGWVDRITIIPAAIGTMAAANGAAGEVTAGVHKLKVVFVTRSGFESSPTTGVVSYTAPGALKISLTNVPLWVAGAGHVDAECTKRLIIMTEAGLDKYFLALTISDNTTATGTVDIADETLREERDFTNHFQYTSPMPSLSTGRIFHERLIANGNSAAGTMSYVSELTSPQSFRGDTGFLDIKHDDGFRLVQTFQMREVFYFIKTLGIYATHDNGLEPNSWPLMVVSEDVGTTSISGVSHQSDEDFVIIAEFRGLYLFTGAPPRKISHDIQPTWDTVNIAQLKESKVYIDTVARRILFLTPTGSATRPDKVFVVDYNDGWAKTKWSVWYTNGTAWRAFIVDYPDIFIATAASTVRKFSESAITDNGTAIDYANRQGILEPAVVGMNLFGGFDMHVTGSGTLNLKAYGPDGTLLQTFTGFTLATAPEKDLFRRMNIRKERIFLEFSHNDAAAASKISRLVVFAKGDGIRAY